MLRTYKAWDPTLTLVGVKAKSSSAITAAAKADSLLASVEGGAAETEEGSTAVVQGWTHRLANAR